MRRARLKRSTLIAWLAGAILLLPAFVPQAQTLSDAAAKKPVTQPAKPAVSAATSRSPVKPLAAENKADVPENKPPTLRQAQDLAELVQGTYLGAVQTDNAATAPPGGTLVVKRIGANRVRVDAEGDRFPPIDIPLTRAVGKVMSNRMDHTFVVDPAKTPRQLHVVFNNQVAWVGERR